MKRRKQRLDKPKFDSSGIGLVPIGYPGEFGFFVDYWEDHTGNVIDINAKI